MREILPLNPFSKTATMKSVYGSFLKTLFGAFILGLFLVGTATETQAQCTIDPVADSTYYPPFPPATCDALVSWETPTISGGGCAGTTLTQVLGPSNGSIFAVGEYLIRYELRDGGGNLLDTEDWTIFVVDTVVPVITGCPDDIVVDQDSGLCGNVVTWVAPNATDACTIDSFAADFSSGDFFPVGVTTVIYAAKDPSGNLTTCGFTITVRDTTMPEITCPGDTSFLLSNLGAGVCSPSLTLDTLVYSDECPVTVSYALSGATTGVGVGPDPSGVYNVGTTTVTFTVDDGTNTSTCSFDVTVTDDVAPVIVCEPDYNFNTDPGSCDVFRAVDKIFTVTESCGYTLDLVYKDEDGNTIYSETATPFTAIDTDIFMFGMTWPVGVNTATYTVTDPSGNTASCSHTFTVTDNEDPTITCPPAQTESLDASCEATVIDYTGLGIANDNCPGVVVTQSPAVGTPVLTGHGTVVPITLTATDEAGNTATCTFNVTYNDVTPPTFDSCPSNMTESTDAGVCTYNYTFTNPSASDNCSVISVVQTAGPASGSDLPLGSTTFTFVATDIAGNTATCSYTVTVEDNEDPVITTCPADDVVVLDGTCSGLLPNLVASAAATDNCSFIITQSPLAGTSYTGDQDVSVTITATDPAGNIDQCTVTVSFEDQSAPTVVCGPDGSFNTSDDATGDCTFTGDFTNAINITDNCEVTLDVTVVNGGVTVDSYTDLGPLTTGAYDLNATFSSGVNVVTYTITDEGGNTASCTNNVVVTDDETPTITCVPAVTQDNDADTCGAVVTFDITATDNCTYTITNDYNAQTSTDAALSFEDFFIVGNTTVTFTVTDTAGLTTSCSVSITINDTEAPDLVCPLPIQQTVLNDTVCYDVIGWSDPIPDDNCALASVIQTSGFSNPGLYAVGNYTVTYESQDIYGNASTCEFRIEVLDDVNPQIQNCPSDITVPYDPLTCGAVVSWVPPTALDNCVGTTLISNYAPSSVFPVGTTDVIYIATDPSGNVDSCVFTVTVEDLSAPVIDCQGDSTVSNDLGDCGAIVTYKEVTFVEDCDTVDITYDGFQGPFDPANWTFSVVSDSTGSVDVSNAPQTVTLIGPDNGYSPTFIDNCSSAGSVDLSITAPFDGEYRFGWSYWTTDGDFRPATYVGTYNPDFDLLYYSVNGTDVLLTDTLGAADPTQSGFVTLNLNAGDVLAFTIESADQCGGGASARFSISATTTGPTATLVQTAGLPSGSFFPVGTTENRWVVTDVSGNVDSCVFNVTVEDVEAPALTCPPDITVYNDPGNCDAFVSLDTLGSCVQIPGFTGYYAPANWTVIQEGNGSVDVSNAPAFLTIIGSDDTSGNISGSFDNGVEIAVSCDGLIEFTWDYTTQDGDGPAFDPFGYTLNGTFVQLTDDNGALSQSGTETVAVSAGDIFGFIQNTDDNCCGVATTVAASFTAPTTLGSATDNCGIASIVNSFTGGPIASGTYPVGTTTVTYTVTDIHGNVSTCSFDVEVIDNEAPTAICQNVNVFLDANGEGSITPAQIDNGSDDNCAIATLVLDKTDFTCADVGVNTVTLTVTDVNGNTATCSADVEVFDNIAPTALCQDITVALDATGNASIVAADIDNGSFDNCAIASLVISQSSFTCGDLGVVPVTLTVTDVNGNVSQCVANVTVVDVIPPTVFCQDVDVFLDATGNASITTMDIDAGSFDNCTIVSTTLDITAFDCDDVGANTVVLTVTDQSGNVSTCSATVNVFDNIAPTAICQNVNVFLDANGDGSITPAQIDNGSFDNCGIASLALDITDFTCADVGINTVVLTVTDVNGNVSTCSADVEVFDNIAPTALCQNITVELDATGNASIVAGDIDAGSFDNCGIASIVASQTSFTCGDLGIVPVTLTVTDVNGNVSQCIAIVTVEDNITPTALCQDLTIYLDDNGDASITAMDIDNGSFDNCTIVNTTIDIDEFDCSNVGANTVVLTVEDQSGNIGTCSATVTVLDTTRPEIVCPPSLIANNAFGLCGNAVQGFQLAQLDDNCGIQTIVNDWTPNGANANAFYPVGTTTVTWLATDVNGNTATCSADVTIIDFERPTLNCPADITVNNDPGVCGAEVSYTIDYFENCPNDTLFMTAGLESGSIFPIGTTTVSYFAEDESGNTSSCSFTVTVIDNEAPVFANCSADITVPNGVGICGAQVFYPTPTATDNCPGMTTTFTGLGSGAIFPVGTTTETYIATDASGNSVLCEFTVTVEDVEDPVITCPADIVVSTDPGVCEANVTIPLPQFSDNCEVLSPLPLPAPTGDATVTLFVRGDYGITSETATLIGEGGVVIGINAGGLGDCNPTYVSSTFTIPLVDISAWAADDVITFIVDNSSAVNSFCVEEDNYIELSYPTATGIFTFVADPQEITLTGQDFTFNVGNFSSNLIVVNDITGGIDASGVYPLGTTPVTYVVTDPSGNTDTCTFNVTVVDTEAPTVVCAADTTITTSSDGTGDCSATLASTFSISDNCSNDIMYVDVTITNGGTTIYNTMDTMMAGTYTINPTFELGDNIVTYSVTDTNGVTGVCQTTVTVVDDELPTITCPASIVVANDPGVCEANVTVPAPVVDDNCSWTVANDYNGTADASDVYPVGSTVVVFTATDGAGNQAQCALQVTVEDTEAPVYTSCPTDTVLTSDTGLCGAIFIYSTPTFTDNCPGATQGLTNGLPSLSIFPVGVTTVEYTATDAAGNTSICTFNVTVIDVEAPQVVLCPDPQTIPSEPGQCGAVATWLPPFFIDNCGVDSTASNFVPGDFFPVGTTTVVYTAFDAEGNSAECAFDITVEDVEAPVFTACPTDIFSCDPVQTWTLPTADDNCAVTAITGTANPGDTFPVGTTTVEYIAEDAAGNTALCSFEVTIYPTPVVDAGADVDVCLNSGVVIGGNPTASAATPAYNYTWSPAAGLDDPTIANPTASPTVSTQYTVTVTDANGCTADDVVDVTVLPLPTVDAGADQAICFGDAITLGGTPAGSGTVAPYTYSWAPAGSLSSANAANPTATPTATTTYTLVVTDANGCSAEDEITITVNPLPDATITAAGPFCLNDGNQTLTAATAGGTWSGNGIVDAAAGTFNPATAGVGVHMITYNVTDANGCSNSAMTTIEVLPLPNSRILPAGPLCSNDDPIFLTGLPNLNPHTWQGPGIVNATTGQFDPAVAGAGNHVVEYIVTNAVGCTDTASIVITVTAAPAVVATPAGPYCETEPVQTLTANVAGGIWSGPGIIQPQLGQFLPIAASAGTHEIVYQVSDNNGCEGADTLTMVVFEVPAITASVTEASCEDAGDGAINISVSGGTAPYSFNWSNGATTEDITGVAAGNYTVVVTDANGCTQDASITIGISVNPVSVAAIVTPATNAAIADGSIDITVTGGVPPYTFVWSNGAQTEDLIGVQPGTYELTIIDDAGCSYVYFYQVDARFGVGIDLANLDQNISLYPNPTSDVINVDIEVGTVNAEMTMTVFDMLGRRVYEVNDAFTGAYQHRIEMTNWAAGQYMVRFNINGQQLTKKFILAR